MSGHLMIPLADLDLGAITIAAPPPDTLTQRNVDRQTGIPATMFLAMVRHPGFPLPVVKLGRLRLVERVAFVAWLKEQAGANAGPANDAAPPVDPIAAMAAEVGLRAIPTAAPTAPSTARRRRP